MNDSIPKSVHITNYYHKNSGGISTSYNNLLAAAGRHKRHVRLIAPGETESMEKVNEFAKIYYVPARYSPLFDTRYRVIMPWHYMLKDSVVRRILLDERPDIIEVTDKYTLSLLGPMIRTNSFKKLGRPILVHFSCERMDDNVRAFISGGRFGRWLARTVMGNYILPSFDYHIANSEYTAAEFYESYSPAENRRRSEWLFRKSWQMLKAPRVALSERIFVCPRGVDTGHFSSERRSVKTAHDMRTRAGVPHDSTLLLYAGRLSPEKNIGLLVEMMKILSAESLRDYRLLVAGAGPKSDWLREQGEKAGRGKIVLLGHLDKETLAEYYANADVFVHPNPKEPFGIAPLEAMSSGVPTVAPNVGGILSYATNENAWLVDPDGSSFAGAVREIVENEALRREKIEKALKTARENTREASTDRLFATYDRLYEDFNKKRELFVDTDASKRFDFITLANA
jgi:glycosyltransferase involved in cell wall biosynthesis